MPTLSEAASKQLLAALRRARARRAHSPPTPTARSAAADAIGYPVVVKLCGDAIAHKTERGLVRLGLRDAAAVRAAATSCSRPPDPTTARSSCSSRRWCAATRELIAGLVRDPQFGPCVMLGVGGVLAEALGDVAFRLVPLTDVDADELIDDLATQKLLGPFRGEPAVDRDALRAALLGLSRLAPRHDPTSSRSTSTRSSSSTASPSRVDALVELRDPRRRHARPRSRPRRRFAI